MLFWIDHAYGLLLAAVVFAALFGLGARWAPGRPTLGFAVGFALVSAVLLVASLLPGIDRIVAFGLFAALLPAAWRGFAILRQVPRPAATRRQVIVGLLLALPYLAQVLLPDHDWDGEAYHVPTARMFLATSAWAVEPILPQNNFPGAVHLVYAWLLQLSGESALIPLNMLVSLLAAAAVGALAAELAGPRAGWIAVLVALTNNQLLELGFDPRIDNFLVLWVVGAAHATLLWCREPQRRDTLALAGVALGLAFGTKYTAALYALVLAVPVLWTAARCRRVAPLALAALLIALPSSFWYVRNSVRLGDPVYPFTKGRVYFAPDGTRVAFQPAVEALIASVGEPPKDFLAPLPATAPQPRNLAKVWEVLFDPDAYENKSLHWISPLAFLFVLLPRWRRDRDALRLYLLCWLGYAALAGAFPTSRYMLPLFLLWSAASGCWLAELTQPRARRILAIALVVLLARQALAETRKLVPFGLLEYGLQLTQWERHPTRKEWSWVERIKPWRLWFGLETENELLVRIGYNRAAVVPRLAEHVRAEIQRGTMRADDTILAFGEDKQGRVPVPMLTDMSRDGARWLVELLVHRGDHAAIAASLAARGVRHVLFNRDYVLWCLKYVAWDDRSDLINRRYLLFSLFQLQKFLQAHGTVVWRWQPERLHEFANLVLMK